jgi:hypothetical protein
MRHSGCSIFIRQVQDNRHGLREHHVAIHQCGDLAGGIDLEECRLPVFPREQVDGGGVEVDSQFLQRPAHTDGSSGGELK